MATVYSLICWGGRTGKSVSGATATDVLTLTNHGLRIGTKVVAQSTVSGVVAGTTYYARGIDVNTFYLYDTLANAQAGGTTGRIDITATTSFYLKSDLVANPATALAAYGLSDLSRWGTSGSELIYDGLSNAASTRSSNGEPGNDEVIEIGEAFTDIYASTIIPGDGFADSYTFHTRINGLRTPAFHNGQPGTGYVYQANTTTIFYATRNSITVDGLDFAANGTLSSTNYYAIQMTYPGNVFANNILRSTGSGVINGLQINAGFAKAYNNIVFGFGYAGILVGGSAIVYNNLVTKCTQGFASMNSGSNNAMCYNNLAVGNTTNWYGFPVVLAGHYSGNIGGTTDLISFTVSGSTVTCASAPPLMLNQRVFLRTTGELPSVGGVPLLTTRTYYVRSISGTAITLGTAYNGGALTFSSAGTGTHTLSCVWDTVQCPASFIDFADPSLVFKDWTNNDFRPAGTGATPAAQALMVDSARSIPVAYLGTDMTGAERPNYNNGGYEASDVGPFEYDHGYGPHPASTTVTFDGVAANSEIRVYNSTGSELAGIESCAANQALTWAIPSPATVRIVIIHTDYAIKEFTYTSISGNQFIPSGQEPDKWYSNPA